MEEGEGFTGMCFCFFFWFCWLFFWFFGFWGGGGGGVYGFMAMGREGGGGQKRGRWKLPRELTDRSC